MTVKITAGLYRGLTLSVPEGRNTRPTASLVREAVFSMLGDAVEGASVLDAFSGSGAMGLEALSRGAQRAVFCDRSPKAAETIRQNILKLPLLEQSKAKVLKLELPRQWSALENQGPFSLFLLDPPYDDPVSAKAILSKAIQSALTANQAAAVWEQAPESLKKWEAGDFSPWELKTTRSWGRRAAAIFTLTKFTQADTEPPENE